MDPGVDSTVVNQRTVPYSYLTKQFGTPEALFQVIRDVITTGRFTLGQELEDLEKAVAHLCGVSDAIGVNSGTDALFLSMKASGIGPGDEVITAPNSFIATAGAIAIAGAKPVFVDVTDDYTIDPALIESKITPRTKAILPVHLTGNPARMDDIMAIAKKHNLLVIEDAAQAIYATYKGQSVGSFGIAGAFSFHPLKNVNGWGDGGMVSTHSKELAQRLRLMRNHGLRNRDEVSFFAYNSRLDTLQAALLLKMLADGDRVTTKRNKNAALYDRRLSQLKGHVQVPPRRPEVRQVFHTYVIQVERRNELEKFLINRGVEVKIHYPIPIHLQDAAQSYGYKRGDFPVTERQAERILTLPIHQYLEEEDISYVCNQIEAFYGARNR